jgi:hypothetical protein
MSTKTTRKPAPRKAAKPTETLPPQILGVARTVTPAQAKSLWLAGDVQRVMACVAARFLVSRGKVKSVRDMATDWGVGKSTVDRSNSAAAIVVAIGATATEQHARDAVQIVNNLSAFPIGALKDYTDATEGPALAKALTSVKRAVAAKASEAQAARRDTAKPRNGKVKIATTDKTRGQAAATTLAAIKDGSKVRGEDVKAILAHALRIAAESGVSADDIAAEVAAARPAEASAAA